MKEQTLTVGQAWWNPKTSRHGVVTEVHANGSASVLTIAVGNLAVQQYRRVTWIDRPARGWLWRYG